MLIKCLKKNVNFKLYVYISRLSYLLDPGAVDTSKIESPQAQEIMQTEELQTMKSEIGTFLHINWDLIYFAV